MKGQYVCGMTTPALPIVIIGAGQSGLVAARAVRDAGLTPVVLEAGSRPAGSWPHYYDSLAAFSPARYSSLPGLAFPGDPDRYPSRDEVIAYLERYAEQLDVEIRTRARVESVEQEGHGFLVHTAGGGSVRAAGLVAASGSFSNPYTPCVKGCEAFTGELMHVARYRRPGPFQGKRVVIVGGGNSAVQIGYELMGHAQVTLAAFEPVQFLAQRPGGRDVHYWTARSGFDHLPPAWLAQRVSGVMVSDDGTYSAAFQQGLLERRPMFQELSGDGVVWSDGSFEPADTILFATGYRPNLEYLRPLGALDEEGLPLHSGGLSLTHPGLVYLGLEFQRSFSSNTLRGVGQDADHVIPPLAAYASDAFSLIGL